MVYKTCFSKEKFISTRVHKTAKTQAAPKETLKMVIQRKFFSKKVAIPSTEPEEKVVKTFKKPEMTPEQKIKWGLEI
jgi:hypothetical protein